MTARGVRETEWAHPTKSQVTLETLSLRVVFISIIS